ncbi:DUF4199 domain-containing protein [Marinilabilia sp.]|uniref:DUF4199 domain-containing protein n=1 Tax=Marinilabilia sp. TaxID=2021252 RepID=UPI0025C60532|nr:DUF4199 domain-containing protein [Marinilabilia sp.]
MDDLSTENTHKDIQKQKARFVLNQGTFMGLALSAVFLILQLTGLETSFFNNVLTWLVYIGFIHVSMVRYRQNLQEGWLGYGQGVWLGTRMGMLAGIISGAWMFLYMKVINPAYTDELIVQMQEAYLAMGMSENEVARMEDMFALVANPVLMIFSGIFGVGFTSLLFSLVIAIFQRRRPQDPFSNAMKTIE